MNPDVVFQYRRSPTGQLGSLAQHDCSSFVILETKAEMVQLLGPRTRPMSKVVMRISSPVGVYNRTTIAAVQWLRVAARAKAVS